MKLHIVMKIQNKQNTFQYLIEIFQNENFA